MNTRSKTQSQHDPWITELVNQAGKNPEMLLDITREISEKRGSIKPGEIEQLANQLKIPASKAYGVASFYSMVKLTGLSETAEKTTTTHICDGPVCWLAGGQAVRQAAEQNQLTQAGVSIERTSCLGLCDRAPAALVANEQAGPLDPDSVYKLAAGWRGQPNSYATPRPGELRVMLAKTGIVDPDSLESALLHAAYQGLAAALRLTPTEVLDEVEQSGLTGRGGAGFLVGRKWRFVAQAARFPKYVICNADESEPLIFKDRVLIDTNPHQILEGMAIAAYATGAEEGFIYIRGEYASQADRLARAIKQAEMNGWLGEQIQGSSFSFHIHVHLGAGAYICGEETALIESLEGSRGEPRLRPPYPPSRGYHDLPTLVNNVESFAATPAILRNGAEWHRTLSGYSTPGTKLYMILGHVNKPGLFEAPFGITLRQAIEFGGGLCASSSFQFALTGGAAGTIVGPELLDTPIDYASAAKGISLGAGAFLVCDQSVSLLEFLQQILYFFMVESCGKCTPCRIGTVKAFQTVTQMVENGINPTKLETIHQLADTLQNASFCGLGQSVAIPIRSAMAQISLKSGLR